MSVPRATLYARIALVLSVLAFGLAAVSIYGIHRESVNREASAKAYTASEAARISSEVTTDVNKLEAVSSAKTAARNAEGCIRTDALAKISNALGMLQNFLPDIRKLVADDNCTLILPAPTLQNPTPVPQVVPNVPMSGGSPSPTGPAVSPRVLLSPQPRSSSHASSTAPPVSSQPSATPAPASSAPALPSAAGSPVTFSPSAQASPSPLCVKLPVVTLLC